MMKKISKREKLLYELALINKELNPCFTYFLSKKVLTCNDGHDTLLKQNNCITCCCLAEMNKLNSKIYDLELKLGIK